MNRRFHKAMGKKMICLRASKAGFKLAIADNCYVFHAKSKSFGSERKEELSKAGHQKLIEKHGELFHNKLEKTKTNPALNQIRAQLNSYIQTIVQDTVSLRPQDLIPSSRQRWRWRCSFRDPRSDRDEKSER